MVIDPTWGSHNTQGLAEENEKGNFTLFIFSSKTKRKREETPGKCRYEYEEKKKEKRDVNSSSIYLALDLLTRSSASALVGSAGIAPF